MDSSQPGRGVGHSYGEVSSGERLGTRIDEESAQERSGDCCLLKLARQAAKHLLSKATGVPSKKTREDPRVLEAP